MRWSSGLLSKVINGFLNLSPNDDSVDDSIGISDDLVGVNVEDIEYVEGGFELEIAIVGNVLPSVLPCSGESNFSLKVENSQNGRFQMIQKLKLNLLLSMEIEVFNWLGSAVII